MNGRVYDYNLGRFLSVDPVIQFPENSQSLNPYSYIIKGTGTRDFNQTDDPVRGLDNASDFAEFIRAESVK